MSEHIQKSFQEQAERRVEAEALGIAKRIQTPGQTREQTKLIAKGIEKGIALYKQQEKAKARERDKARKKAQRQKQQAGTDVTTNDGPPRLTSVADFPEPALWVCGILFGAGALAHLSRLWLDWPLVIGPLSVPMAWSLPLALFGGALSGWLFWLIARHRRG